jgi:hypothetical protein
VPASETRRATLEAIAYGDDQRVTPADRLRALEQLGDVPDDQAVLRLAAEVHQMTDAELEHDLAGFGSDDLLPRADVERLVASQTRERVAKVTKGLRENHERREAELDAEVSRRVEEELRNKGRGPTEEVIDGTAEEVTDIELYLEPPSFDELAPNVREAARAAYKRGDDPFKVIEDMDPDPRPAGPRQFLL